MSERRVVLISVSYLLIVLMTTMGAQADIPAIEREALIALYNSTDGENWNSNFSWLGAPGTECIWNGVTCSATHAN